MSSLLHAQRSRRAPRLIVLSVLTVTSLVAAACGDDAADDAADVPASTLTPTPAPASTAAEGGTEADDQRVVALDEFAGLAALSLGVTPVDVSAVFGYGTAAAVFESAGVPMSAGTAEVPLEAVAALDPSVIIGVSIPTSAAVEPQLDAIAPTTIIDYSASWQDQLRQVGAALGREAEAESLVVAIEADVAALADDVAAAGVTGTTVSVVGSSAGELFALSRTGNVGSILQQAGLGRPAAQDIDTEATNPFVLFSAEELAAHDAARLIVLSGSAYPPGDVTGSPLFDGLSAAAADAVTEVSAEMWFSPNAFGTAWIIADLRAVLLGDGTVAADADAAARWEAFRAAFEAPSTS